MSTVLPPPRRRSTTAPAGRSRALVVLAVVAALLALGMVADILAAPAPAQPPAPIPQEPASAGTWYCPAVAGEGEAGILTIAAVGEEPSQIIVDRYAKGRATPDDPIALRPGGVAALRLTGDDARAPSAVRWTGGPAVAHWRVDGERTAAAPCEPAPAERWYIPGFNTDLGSEATLHLFNPFTSDAVVRLLFATPKGERALVLADNILVGNGGTTTVSLRKYVPEEPDLGVRVEVLSGRVVAQGEQTVDPPGKASGATGRLLLPAANAPSETWSFGYAAGGKGNESWLSVLNPNDADAAVEVRVTAPSENATNLAQEISIPPGGLGRIELEGLSKRAEFGLTLNVVNGEPVVVSRTSAITVDGRVTLEGGLGTPAPSDTIALVGGGARTRSGQVSVYNPGAEVVTVDLLSTNAPKGWAGIQLRPNTRQAFDLADAGADRYSTPVVVRGDGPVVAEVRSRSLTGSSLRRWINAGVASSEWIGALTRPPVRRDPSLSTHAGRPPASSEEPDLLQFDDATEPPAGGDAEATPGADG